MIPFAIRSSEDAVLKRYLTTAQYNDWVTRGQCLIPINDQELVVLTRGGGVQVWKRLSQEQYVNRREVGFSVMEKHVGGETLYYGYFNSICAAVRVGSYEIRAVSEVLFWTHCPEAVRQIANKTGWWTDGVDVHPYTIPVASVTYGVTNT